jgi:outer membrane receptor protein involved in Fe transport
MACIAAGLPTFAAAQARTELAPLVVTATRSPQEPAHLPVTVDLFRSEEFQAGSSMLVDEVLKASAAFSLFRRTGSLMANPTAQGVSLRNLGPSGAGRTLVLLDGVPLNDPFGGWIAWTKIPRLTLAGAEIVRGGGSSAWGSAAVGGTVQFLSAPPAVASESGFNSRLLLEAGDFSTRAAEMVASLGAGAHRWDLAGRAFSTDGFWRVAASDRDSVDRRTDSDHQVAQLRWEHSSSNGTVSGVTARLFREDRGNGTHLQRNTSREQFVSGRSSGRVGADGNWTAAAYLQSQEFSNVFSSVSADRQTETLALDQFAVPADAAGAAVTGSWRSDSGATTTTGLDVRWVRGETQEAFFLQSGRFTRERYAGGEQRFIGAFLQHDRALSSRWRAQLGGRVDHWDNRDGHRREIERANGVLLRDDRFPDRDGWEFSPGGGLVWQATDQARLRAAAYRAFRVPTLNELYRPFRVGNVITEANARLRVETVNGAEVGTDYDVGDWRLGATAFWNELHDAVANVTLGLGPGTIPEVGFVPAGGAGRQRRNLDEIHVRGLELSGHWRVSATWELRLDALFSDATVQRAGHPATSLVGRRLAQVPRYTVVTALRWQPIDRWTIGAQLRHVSQAYEDDANRWSLAPATTIDLRIARKIGSNRAGEWFISMENIADETIEAGRDADGRVDLGQPRFAHGGIRWAW